MANGCGKVGRECREILQKYLHDARSEMFRAGAPREYKEGVQTHHVTTQRKVPKRKQKATSPNRRKRTKSQKSSIYPGIPC